MSVSSTQVRLWGQNGYQVPGDTATTDISGIRACVRAVLIYCYITAYTKRAGFPWYLVPKLAWHAP